MESRSLITACLLGAAAGIRSITPVAFVSGAVARGRWSLDGTPLSRAGDDKVALALAAAAGGEMVVDKLPFVPSRTALPVWLWRMAVGASVGAAAAIAGGKSPAPAAVAAAGAAGASTYGSYQARMALQRQAHLPSPLAGLVGDALAVALSLIAVRITTSAPRGSLLRNFLRR